MAIKEMIWPNQKHLHQLIASDPNRGQAGQAGQDAEVLQIDFAITKRKWRFLASQHHRALILKQVQKEKPCEFAFRFPMFTEISSAPLPMVGSMILLETLPFIKPNSDLVIELHPRETDQPQLEPQERCLV